MKYILMGLIFIKKLRKSTAMKLKEAKDYVDSLLYKFYTRLIVGA